MDTLIVLSLVIGHTPFQHAMIQQDIHIQVLSSLNHSGILNQQAEGMVAFLCGYHAIQGLCTLNHSGISPMNQQGWRD